MRCNFKISIIIFLLFAIFWKQSLSQEHGSCQSKLSAIQNILNRDNGNSDSSCAIGTCQGKPGKRGPAGPRGPFGSKGPSGPKGSCKCDLSVVEELKQQIRELQHAQRMVSKRSALCYAGIASGKITASSTHGSCQLKNVHINSGGAWCAGTNDANQWVQVDLKSPKQITGIATRGRFDCCPQWIKTYKVSYGNSVSNLTIYEENGSPKIFFGNSDKNTIVKRYFREPITARYFRIHPLAFNSWRSMRIELLDC